MNLTAKKLFVTGVGTDVGKTYVSSLIVKKLHDSGYSCAYYKGAMSGNARDHYGVLIPGDARFVKDVSGIEQNLSSMCPYVYEAAVSPHLAARIEGNPIQMDVIRSGLEALCHDYDYIAIEGSGGIVCPLRFDGQEIWLEDVVRENNLGCVIVSSSGLGAINGVTLTVEYMRARKIPIQGVIFNRFHPGDVMEEDNVRMCERRTGIKRLACVQEGDNELDIDVETLKSLFSI